MYRASALSSGNYQFHEGRSVGYHKFRTNTTHRALPGWKNILNVEDSPHSGPQSRFHQGLVMYVIRFEKGTTLQGGTLPSPEC